MRYCVVVFVVVLLSLLSIVSNALDLRGSQLALSDHFDSSAPLSVTLEAGSPGDAQPPTVTILNSALKSVEVALSPGVIKGVVRIENVLVGGHLVVKSLESEQGSLKSLFVSGCSVNGGITVDQINITNSLFSRFVDPSNSPNAIFNTSVGSYILVKFVTFKGGESHGMFSLEQVRMSSWVKVQFCHFANYTLAAINSTFVGLVLGSNRPRQVLEFYKNVYHENANIDIHLCAFSGTVQDSYTGYAVRVVSEEFLWTAGGASSLGWAHSSNYSISNSTFFLKSTYKRIETCYTYDCDFCCEKRNPNATCSKSSCPYPDCRYTSCNCKTVAYDCPKVDPLIAFRFEKSSFEQGGASKEVSQMGILLKGNDVKFSGYGGRYVLYLHPDISKQVNVLVADGGSYVSHHFFLPVGANIAAFQLKSEDPLVVTCNSMSALVHRELQLDFRLASVKILTLEGASSKNTSLYLNIADSEIEEFSIKGGENMESSEFVSRISNLSCTSILLTKLAFTELIVERASLKTTVISSTVVNGDATFRENDFSSFSLSDLSTSGKQILMESNTISTVAVKKISQRRSDAAPPVSAAPLLLAFRSNNIHTFDLEDVKADNTALSFINNTVSGIATFDSLVISTYAQLTLTDNTVQKELIFTGCTWESTPSTSSASLLFMGNNKLGRLSFISSSWTSSNAQIVGNEFRPQSTAASAISFTNLVANGTALNISSNVARWDALGAYIYVVVLENVDFHSSLVSIENNEYSVLYGSKNVYSIVLYFKRCHYVGTTAIVFNKNNANLTCVNDCKDIQFLHFQVAVGVSSSTSVSNVSFSAPVATVTDVASFACLRSAAVVEDLSIKHIGQLQTKTCDYDVRVENFTSFFSDANLGSLSFLAGSTSKKSHGEVLIKSSTIHGKVLFSGISFAATSSSTSESPVLISYNRLTNGGVSFLDCQFFGMDTPFFLHNTIHQSNGKALEIANALLDASLLIFEANSFSVDDTSTEYSPTKYLEAILFTGFQLSASKVRFSDNVLRADVNKLKYGVGVSIGACTQCSVLPVRGATESEFQFDNNNIEIVGSHSEIKSVDALAFVGSMMSRNSTLLASIRNNTLTSTTAVSVDPPVACSLRYRKSLTDSLHELKVHVSGNHLSGRVEIPVADAAEMFLTDNAVFTSADPAILFQRALDLPGNDLQYLKVFRCNMLNGAPWKRPSSISISFLWLSCGECSTLVDCVHPHSTNVLGTAPNLCYCQCKFISSREQWGGQRCDEIVTLTPSSSTTINSTWSVSFGSLSLSETNESSISETFLPTSTRTFSNTNPHTSTMSATTSVSLDLPFFEKFSFPTEKILRGVAGDGATAVAGTTVVASIVSAGVSPAAATQAVRIGPAVRSIHCKFNDGDLTPAASELIPFIDVGSTKFSKLVGAELITSIVVTLITAITMASFKFLERFNASKGAEDEMVGSIPLRVLGFLLSLLIAYYVPSVLGTGVTIMSHSTGIVDICIALFSCLLVLCACVTPVGYVVLFAFDAEERVDPLPGDEGISDAQKRLLLKAEFCNLSRNRMYVETFSLFFDASSKTSKRYARLYYFEELFVSILFCMIGGIRRTIASCYDITALLLLISLLHLGYLIVVRPYKARADIVLSFFFAVNQVFLAVCCMAAISHDEAETVVGVAIIIQMVAFAFQLLSSALWAITALKQRALRRKLRSATQKVSNSSVTFNTSCVDVDDAPVQLSPVSSTKKNKKKDTSSGADHQRGLLRHDFLSPHSVARNPLLDEVNRSGKPSYPDL